MKYKVKNLTVISSFLPAYKIQAKKIYTAMVVSYIKFKLKYAHARLALQVATVLGTF